MRKNIAYIGLIIIGLTSCGEADSEGKNKNHKPRKRIVEQVDDAFGLLKSGTGYYVNIADLDHHRMAEQVGVYTPPAIATLFGDVTINSTLIKENQMLGLDLPFKFLCYAEADTSEAKIAYTSAEFIQKRHGVDASLMTNYKSNLTAILDGLPKDMISETDVSSVNKGFGIVTIKSDYDYTSTVERLKDIVHAQDDTQWFGYLDYQQQSLETGLELRPTILLLFGGPGPGGKAMMNTPKIGLDAFCQKLLVYENENGEVWVAFNDIVAFAELYYQTSTKPQKMINQRLIETFTKAITIQTEV